jgi:P-type Ca2+ transporter type 2C
MPAPPTKPASTDAQIYNLEIHQALETLNATPDGLTDAEVLRRRAQFGPNALTPKSEPWYKRIVEPFASPFVLVLVAAMILSVVEHEYIDAVIIGIIVGVNAVIYYFQQFSVSRVLNTLKNQDVSYVHVMRDGRTVRLKSEELVPGDVVHVEEGMKVPADGRLIESNQVEADEALLTGESLPVHKQAGALTGHRRVYDQANMIFKGTYIKTGSGLMVVARTGNQTELGSITELAAGADIGRSPIERKIDSFTKRLIVVVLLAAALALALALWRGIMPQEAVRFSLVVMVSAVPEGLPVALTIVLLLSARRMARVKALVKKISSIETMGAVTIIATDKTGTITQNQLSVADKFTIHAGSHTFDGAILASLNGDEDHAGDALDDMLGDSVAEADIPRSWRKVKDFAFNQEMRVSGALWQTAKGYTLHIKGAPEHILSHCTPRLPAAGAAIDKALADFTGRGYRTIAFAHKDFPDSVDSLETTSVLAGASFDGFVGLSDQLRPGIQAAISEAHQAGIKVVMLTGDHVNTARFIAQTVGIARTPAEVADSSVLAHGNADDIRTALQSTRVFGRVLPEHKYALLKAIKGQEITAMTGDGVNDIPALVEADAGIAMGSGTDAAKDASDIVLLDNNFRTIVDSVRVGRTALANIRKMLVYVLGTSFGEVLTMLLALIIGIPLPVAAIQILWINLVTDGMTLIPLGLSPAESRQMQQPPRSPQAPLLDVRQVTRIVMMGVVMSVTVLWLYNLNLHKGHAYAQTLAFLSLIVVQWANALNINFEYKSWLYNFVRPNYMLWGAIGLSILVQIVVFATPWGRLLEVVPVTAADAFIAVVVPTLVMLAAVDLHKLLWHLPTRRGKV